jgi:hypothetical protein
MDLSKLPKRLRKPLITKQLIIKVPASVDPSGIAVDVPAAMKAAARPKPGDDPNFDLRLLTHLMRRQFSKLDPNAVGDPAEYVRQMRIGLNPRDKIEEILGGSILLTYGRLAHLSHAAANCKDEIDLMNLYAAAERTANSLRRQLMCLSRHREQFADKMSPPEKKLNLTNELGFPHAPKNLPTYKTRPGISPRRGSYQSAVEKIDRPENLKWKKNLVAQRLQARRANKTHLPPPRAATR